MLFMFITVSKSWQPLDFKSILHCHVNKEVQTFKKLIPYFICFTSLCIFFSELTNIIVRSLDVLPDKRSISLEGEGLKRKH